MITVPTAQAHPALPHAALRAAAVAYPAAWVAGLALGSGPGLDATPQQISEHYVRAGGPAALQSTLVHGVAAVALLVVGLAVVRSARAVGSRWARAGAAALGVAVATSLAQMVLGLTAVARGGDADVASEAFAAIGRLDGSKMLALAVLVVVGVRLARRGGLPGWLAPLGAVLAALLAVSAVGYLLLAPAPALAALAGLPLLLLWVCGAGLALGRR